MAGDRAIVDVLAGLEGGLDGRGAALADGRAALHALRRLEGDVVRDGRGVRERDLNGPGPGGQRAGVELEVASRVGGELELARALLAGSRRRLALGGRRRRVRLRLGLRGLGLLLLL